MWVILFAAFAIFALQKPIQKSTCFVSDIISVFLSYCFTFFLLTIFSIIICPFYFFLCFFKNLALIWSTLQSLSHFLHLYAFNVEKIHFN